VYKVSDSAVNMLSTAAKSWRKRKNSDITIGSPATPQRTTPSPHFFPSTKETPTTASAAELRKATKLAKLALNFSRKRGQSAYKEELAPFVFRNRLGMQVNFSASGISTTIVDDGEDAQFHMHPVSSRIHGQKDRRMGRYDGHFPTVDIEPYFGGLDTACSTANECWKDVHANPVTDLPTGKVGTTLRSVRIWKKKGDSILSQQILVYWEVKLEENRRVLILSSATNIKVFGSMSAIEVGVRFSNDDNGVSGEIATVGTTSQEGIFLPLWVESCFRSVEVFIRPLVMDAGACIYTWSTFPILCLNSDGFEVGCNWIAESVLSSGGVSCPLNRLEDQHIYNPVWLQCSYSYDSLNGSGSSPSSVQQHDNHVLTSVTIWSAITIRNMLP